MENHKQFFKANKMNVFMCAFFFPVCYYDLTLATFPLEKYTICMAGLFSGPRVHLCSGSCSTVSGRTRIMAATAAMQ